MEKEKEKIKFSNMAIGFISNYMVDELPITGEIDEDMLSKIYSLADKYDSFVATPMTNPQYEFDLKKSEAAGAFAAEYETVISENKTFDLADLNRRLDFFKK